MPDSLVIWWNVMVQWNWNYLSVSIADWWHN